MPGTTLASHRRDGLTAVRAVVTAVVGVIPDDQGEPRGIMCLADGDLQVRYENEQDRTYSLTASTDVHPISPTEILDLGGGTFDLCY